jgi:hypothetical protein
MPVTINLRAIVRSFVLLIAIAAYSGVLFICNRWYDRLDPQGGGSSLCTKTELPVISNGEGWVVSEHHTICDAFGGGAATYVYVHSVNKSESRRSLVFSFLNSYSDNYKQLILPKIVWTNNSTLQISVDHLVQVTKQLDRIAGIKIIYVIGKTDYSRNIEPLASLALYPYALLALFGLAAIMGIALRWRAHSAGEKFLPKYLAWHSVFALSGAGLCCLYVAIRSELVFDDIVYIFLVLALWVFVFALLSNWIMHLIIWWLRSGFKKISTD